MKINETVTIGENDMYMVEVSSGGPSIFYGPCNLKKCEKIAVKQLRRWQTVKFHWLAEPSVVLDND